MATMTEQERDDFLLEVRLGNLAVAVYILVRVLLTRYEWFSCLRCGRRRSEPRPRFR